MIQTKLVNRDVIAKYKQISKNINSEILDQYIIEAQIQDVRPLLGEKLFDAIIETPLDYTILLEGGQYTYDGVTCTNYGLEAVLSYYVYARYAMFGSATDTPFSMVEKLNGQESRPVDYSFKKGLYTLNRDSAFNLWRSVEKYLIRTNNELFLDKCLVKNNNFHFNKIK